MPLTELTRDFKKLKQVRRAVPPADALVLVGKFAVDALTVLAMHAVAHDFEWKGGGHKTYRVYTLADQERPFSRPINTDLFLADPTDFREHWDEFVECATSQASANKRALDGMDADLVGRLFYTAVVGYAAAVDLFRRGDRGGPGTFFEMAVGPTLSLLTRRPETGSIVIPVPEIENETETVPVDLSFISADEDVVLIVPTKISTRERISQAYVHQRILESASMDGKIYRSVLAICNENNVMHPSGTPETDRTYANGWAVDTLVPGTIALYQRYVSQLSGLYYLDPPPRYIDEQLPGFPPVHRFGQLLTTDLPGLLAST